MGQNYEIGSSVYDSRHAVTFTTFFYEQLCAIKLAAQRAGLSRNEIENLFFHNASRLFQARRLEITEIKRTDHGGSESSPNGAVTLFHQTVRRGCARVPGRIRWIHPAHCRWLRGAGDHCSDSAGVPRGERIQGSDRAIRGRRGRLHRHSVSGLFAVFWNHSMRSAILASRS